MHLNAGGKGGWSVDSLFLFYMVAHAQLRTLAYQIYKSVRPSSWHYLITLHNFENSVLANVLY